MIRKNSLVPYARNFFTPLFTFASCALLLAGVSCAENRGSILNRVPANDAELEAALTSLFIRELGYTLIGEKPVSINEGGPYLRDHPDANKKVYCFLENAFKKSPTFILKMSGESDGYFSVELIHKVALSRVIKKNPELQEFITKKFKTIKNFFSALRCKKNNITQLLNHDDFLLGLVFGYGHDNSAYYSRRAEIWEYLQKLEYLDLVPFLVIEPSIHIYMKPLMIYSLDVIPAPVPKANKQFCSLKAEWEWIQQAELDLRKLCRPNPPYYVHLPFYICRRGGDSEQVREKYVKASGRLASLFCNRSFAEAIAEEASKG